MSLKQTLIACAVIGGVALAAGSAISQAPPVKADDLVVRAKSFSYRLRTGRYELAPESVAMLEAAVQAHPKDGRLWNELGVAYFQALTAGFNGAMRIDFPATLRKAGDAHKRALALDPNDPVALAGHGTSMVIASQFARDPTMAAAGKAELDRAIALAPDLTVIRLQRGFTHLGVGPGRWDPAAAEADLTWLIRRSEGSRSGDVLHVLLGDLYAETGRADLARAEYAVAARPGSASHEMAQARLAADLPAERAKLRGAPARDCGLCHGS